MKQIFVEERKQTDTGKSVILDYFSSFLHVKTFFKLANLGATARNILTRTLFLYLFQIGRHYSAILSPVGMNRSTLLLWK